MAAWLPGVGERRGGCLEEEALKVDHRSHLSFSPKARDREWVGPIRTAAVP